MIKPKPLWKRLGKDEYVLDDEPHKMSKAKKRKIEQLDYYVLHQKRYV